MFGQTLNRTENIIKNSEIRIQDLDAQVRALKLENEKLKRENDELRERAIASYVIHINKQIYLFSLYSGIDEGRRLMANRDSLSYAAELEVLSKDEVRIEIVLNSFPKDVLLIRMI
jgi:predicted RNase H-like nuclease (RuvC/YqgF family)